ncbi:DUF2231 domain-containing protein [Paracoccus ravus]|uniref:DUF2231 domain-containing protein n=1 Tax=Paracoccus ravus TaxID=2447760 RepID=UPI00106EF020|nr:DUF2231 domain-containing protein [Paracoccus ravus]
MTWHPADTAVPARSRLLPILAAFPVACFTLALGSDLAYWQTANLMWLNFSSWLLASGLAAGVLFALWWAIGLLTGWWRAGWRGALLGLAVLLVAFANNLVHAGDGWTAVVPWGIALSALAVLLMLASALLDSRAAY